MLAASCKFGINVGSLIRTYLSRLIPDAMRLPSRLRSAMIEDAGRSGPFFLQAVALERQMPGGETPVCVNQEARWQAGVTISRTKSRLVSVLGEAA
jgi:hypothetical protein